MESLRTLIVCEKPDAAWRVARSLDKHGEPRKRDLQGVPFFECETTRDAVVVCSALGHLYAVHSKGRSNRRYYPIWDFGWKPKHEIERASAGLTRWVRVISSLARDAERFVNACDYDIEGSLIGHTVLQYACNGAHSKAERMRFSTMTEKELKAAFRALSPRLDFPFVEAGKCRHELDWLYGINLSRIMTESVVKLGKGYATLSTGRVQGPTLAFVVEREEEIGCFVPTPFWTIESTVEYEGRDYKIEYYKERIPTLQEAEQIASECRGTMLVVSGVESREFQQPPPFPFDISSLQSEAFQHFGYSPARTLAVAERLYLEALISYPRTSSQKLPPDIGYVDILRGISSQRDYHSLVGKLLSTGRLHPTQGGKEDPAHPAIYPTGESPTHPLTGPEARLYDLIVRRFMAAFAPSCLRQSSRIILEHAQHRFLLRGSQILEPGWTEFYQPYLSEFARELPGLEVGMKLPLSDLNASEKFTQPPPRYNPNSLLKRMEQENIGTKATRAQIIDILYRRGYIRELRMMATPLAIEVVHLLERYCPVIIHAGSTARLEDLMEQIQQGTTSRKRVLVEALERLRPIMSELMGREDLLGNRLANVVSAQKIADATLESPCPECGSAIRIVRNSRTGKRFLGCTGKWEKGCTFSLPLPQFGRISILSRNCKTCGFQLVQVNSKGRRSLVSCPRCYVSKSRQTRSTPSATEVATEKAGKMPADYLKLRRLSRIWRNDSTDRKRRTSEAAAAINP